MPRREVPGLRSRHADGQFGPMFSLRARPGAAVALPIGFVPATRR